MYWRYVWRNRVKAKFFNPYRAIPSVVTFVLVFIWKHNANKTPFTEMWVTVTVTVGVYLGLYWLNVSFSRRRKSTGSKSRSSKTASEGSTSLRFAPEPS